MNIDINELLADMMAAIKGSIGEDWVVVRSTVNTYLQNKKQRLELLIKLRIENQIDDNYFKDRIEDEKLILESELHSLAIISKVTAQNAANAALKVLYDTIQTALGIII